MRVEIGGTVGGGEVGARVATGAAPVDVGRVEVAGPGGTAAELLIAEANHAKGEQIPDTCCVLNGLKHLKNQKSPPPIPRTQSQVLSFLMPYASLC